VFGWDNVATSTPGVYQPFRLNNAIVEDAITSYKDTTSYNRPWMLIDRGVHYDPFTATTLQRSGEWPFSEPYTDDVRSDDSHYTKPMSANDGTFLSNSPRAGRCDSGCGNCEPPWYGLSGIKEVSQQGIGVSVDGMCQTCKNTQGRVSNMLRFGLFSSNECTTVLVGWKSCTAPRPFSGHLSHFIGPILVVVDADTDCTTSDPPGTYCYLGKLLTGRPPG
jgi:hypothetical protein